MLICLKIYLTFKYSTYFLMDITDNLNNKFKWVEKLDIHKKLNIKETIDNLYNLIHNDFYINHENLQSITNSLKDKFKCANRLSL